MILEGRVYCEGPDCKVSAHVGPDTMRHGRLPLGFLRVIEYGGSSDPEFAFCCSDCLMKWAAQVPPPEVIPVVDEEPS